MNITPNTRAEALPLDDEIVQTTVTSPPYWGQRDYGYAGQSGVEGTYVEYLDWWADVMRELHRVTRDDGTAWIVVGDTYNTRTVIRPSPHQAGLGFSNESTRSSWAQNRDRGMVRYSARQPGLKDKDLMLLPARMAMVAQEVGWWLRCDIVWAKPWCTPENAPDRPARSHESVFLFSKRQQNAKSRRTPYMSEHRSVWTIAPSTDTAGPAKFPAELVIRCLEGTSEISDVVLDPFAGSGTTLRVAESMDRVGIGFDAAPACLVDAWASC